MNLIATIVILILISLDCVIFQLSLFAEAFHEMLQYQMGCRILSFLEVESILAFKIIFLLA